MNNALVALLAYLTDKVFGEFHPHFHPVITIGQLISWFEKHFYQESITRGFLLLLFVTGITYIVTLLITLLLALFVTPLETFFTALIASMFLAHRMLHDAVLDVIMSKEPRQALSMLVSRDTKALTESEVNKACIETYAENLSDGVIAPLLYLLLFGLPGIVFYKSVNTLDSMVGYRTPRYEKFGKASAYLDDLLNYIPSRITALLIMLLSKNHPLWGFYQQGRLHESPNAGHPITAMALALKIKLGGDTVYFGQVKKKAGFGEGKEIIISADVQKALSLRQQIDLLLISLLTLLVLLG